MKQAPRHLIWARVPLGQPYVTVAGVPIRYRPLQSILPGRHMGSWYEDPDGNRQKIKYHRPTKVEAYQLANGNITEEQLAMPPEGTPSTPTVAAEKLVPLRPMSERIERVRETYGFRKGDSGDIWQNYTAVENGVDKHEVIALLTRFGWVPVSCDCEAFDFYDEMCVHCAYLSEWLEEESIDMGTGSGNGTAMVLAEPTQLVERRSRQADFYAVVNDIYFAGKGTPQLLDFVSVYCERNHLDIFAGHVHVIERRSKVKVQQGDREVEQWKSTWSVMTGIHGYLAQAEETGEYRGVTNKQWCGQDEVWKDVWLSKDPPAAARITVHRKDRMPIEGIATWDVKAQYVDEWAGQGPNRHRTGNRSLSGLWASDAPGQLMKCALSQALRLQFPNNPRFRTDGLETLTVDAVPMDGEGERVVVGDGELSAEQRERIAEMRRQQDEPVDAQFRDGHDAEIDDLQAAIEAYLGTLAPNDALMFTTEIRSAFSEPEWSPANLQEMPVEALRWIQKRVDRRLNTAASKPAAAPTVAAQPPQASEAATAPTKAQRATEVRAAVDAEKAKRETEEANARAEAERLKAEGYEVDEAELRRLALRQGEEERDDPFGPEEA